MPKKRSKKRGPQFSGFGASKSASRTPAPRGRRAKSGTQKIWLAVGAVIAAAAIAGVLVQSSRPKTEPAKSVTPKHALGPEGAELLGDSAPVLVEEYADYQCPNCARWQATMGSTIKQLVADKKIQFALHEFPFLGEESFRAAAAATCAGDVGIFWPYHELLYAKQPPENSGVLTAERLVGFGKEAGIKGKAFRTFERCVDANRYDSWVRKLATAAARDRGIAGTPTVFVNGTQLSPAENASPEKLIAAVDAATVASATSTTSAT